MKKLSKSPKKSKKNLKKQLKRSQKQLIEAQEQIKILRKEVQKKSNKKSKKNQKKFRTDKHFTFSFEKKLDKFFKRNCSDFTHFVTGTYDNKGVYPETQFEIYQRILKLSEKAMVFNCVSPRDYYHYHAVIKLDNGVNFDDYEQDSKNPDALIWRDRTEFGGTKRTALHIQPISAVKGGLSGLAKYLTSKENCKKCVSATTYIEGVQNFVSVI